MNERLQFGGEPIAVDANMAVSGFGPVGAPTIAQSVNGHADACGNVLADEPQEIVDQLALASLRPLGQVRDSFILAVNPDGLWIIDQHVAHERVLFEKILHERGQNNAAQDGQRLLMPLIVELTPGQQAVFTEISEELQRNGFEVELFGTRTVAVKTAPGGVRPADVEKMLTGIARPVPARGASAEPGEDQGEDCASIACHAAIKINMPLEQNKMEWLLKELAKTECPDDMSARASRGVEVFCKGDTEGV